eukprot:2273086-Rhodomonas_salina.1
MGIWVSGLLAAGAWVVSRRLLRRLGIINCFVRMVQQCQCAWCGSCVRLVRPPPAPFRPPNDAGCPVLNV